MSIDYSNLCSLIINQCFGEVVQKVADCLFGAVSRTLIQIIKATNLTRREVSNALAVLIKFNIASFNASNLYPHLPEYSLKRQEILFILRYARYAHLAHTKYGNIGAAIAEEILHAGSETATNILIKCVTAPDNKDKIETYRDVLLTMIKDNYLIKMPMLKEPTNSADVVPQLHVEVYDLYNPPVIDLISIAKIQAGSVKPQEAKDYGIYWRINFNRFHQDFRDNVMVAALERKLGTSAGECFQFILKQMYERTDPWQKQSMSNPFTFVEIKQAVEKKSNNLDLIKNLDSYVTLIADDSLGFLRRVGNMGGGQYVVDMSCAFEELSLVCIEHIITERFGSKASRIFRVVRIKKHIEQEDLQKEAMIPAKEAKLLSYSLFQEQFLQIKTIRKAGGGGSGPAKSFYLFQLKHMQIAKMLLDICYKALYNNITRSNYEKSENKRLIDKSQKLDSIIGTMKDRGETEEYIAEILETLTPPERQILDSVKHHIKTLSKAELELDETIFLLQMYLYHSTQSPSSSSEKKK
ncbi:DNA-directed RNA polymerase III subunit RPC3-like [Teleopsis dalmanni]|uniref:DNA-directed RNA polymerase III subunit RPC3-like n=1 Tax=Teleopsis dalmanni TaxID=139649 RepID=UPI0018CCAE37|nr:DNA-directed RNA polymerase III subunit RPC3-like [Teleopsis dalmanni]XP_037955968.1 DNA-directed RNA polymerase III subunit RPC3-like [Teleopsis dalmanni]